MVGTNALVSALPRHGAADVLYRIATQTTFPSWGFMLERDATTLWEAWSDDRDEQLSLNMKLLGSIDKFFYRDVAGIRPLAPGFRRIAVAPRVVGPVRPRLRVDRDRARTGIGLVAAGWRRHAAPDGRDSRQRQRGDPAPHRRDDRASGSPKAAGRCGGAGLTCLALRA